MMTAISEESTTCGEYYSEINAECEEGPFATAIKSGGYASGYFQKLGEYIRALLLPHIHGTSDPFFLEVGKYVKEFTSMLRGENKHLDPTFSHLEAVIKHFTLKDVPIKIQYENTTYHFTVRFIESKQELSGKKLRLILFSFSGHQVTSDESISKWDPKSMDEISGAVLEVLKILQEQGEEIGTLMTFSLGNIALDGLKHLSPEDTTIPKTIVINRGFASTEKTAKKAYPNIYPLVYNATCLTHLNANPEQELLHFFNRIQTSPSASMEGRKVVLIEAKYDRYFNGASAFDPDYHKQLEAAGAEAYRGSYFAIPGIAADGHHALREDLMVNATHGGSTENFFPAAPNESLSDTLIKNVFSKDGTNTCFIVGGNRDNLDSVTYLRAMPLLSSFVKLNED